jgi:hypothetical protein
MAHSLGEIWTVNWLAWFARNVADSSAQRTYLNFGDSIAGRQAIRLAA